MARNRQTAWRVEGYRQEIRDHGGPLAETRGQERTAFPDRRVFRHGGFVAGRGQAHAPQDRLMPRRTGSCPAGQAHAPQAAPYRQTRVRQARRGGGLPGLLLVGAALREEVARGAPVRRRRVPRARLARRRHAGRFRRGRRHDRRRGRQGPLPGRHVPALEHAVRGRDAGRERGMRVRGAGPDPRPHRHGAPRAGARQRHAARATASRGTRSPWCACSPCSATTTGSRRGPATRIPATRKGPSRTRSASCAATSWPQAQRGEPQTAGEASAVEVRRDRGRGPLPFRQADTRAVRRGARGDAAAAARVSTRSNESSARPTRRATSRSARPVTSRARHGAAGRCSPACARSRRRSAPPTAGT